MAETKHTPEPWKWYDRYYPSGGDKYESLESEKERILLHNAVWEINPEYKALIAAVPEMVEFISKIASGDIEDLIERKSELAEEAKPILAKAGRK